MALEVWQDKKNKWLVNESKENIVVKMIIVEQCKSPIIKELIVDNGFFDFTVLPETRADITINELPKSSFNIVKKWIDKIDKFPLTTLARIKQQARTLDTTAT